MTNQMKNLCLTWIISSMTLVTANVALAANEVPANAFSGSWIADAGPDQLKTVASYTPIGGGKFAAVESVINFDWTLGGTVPAATHGSTLNGIIKKNNEEFDFVLITYALDAQEKAVYIIKATGNKVLTDRDTMNVKNVVLHIYTHPETDNPVIDTADFTIPPTGALPTFHEYRIR